MDLHKFAWRDGVHKLQELWQEEKTYIFHVVSDDGKNEAHKSFDTSFLRKLTYGVGGVALAGVLAVGFMHYKVSEYNSVQQELAEYRATKAAQEKKLDELNKLTTKVQEDMAALSKVEEQLRQQMAKSGMHVPKKALDPAQYGGKGGPGDMTKLMTRIDVTMAQNKNLQATIQAQTKDLQRLVAVLKEENMRKDAAPNHWPLAGGVITSRFGGRRDPIVGGRENHPGIDVGAAWGTPVYAAGAGYVRQAEWFFGYGKFIRIDHGYGYQTAYGHLSTIGVRPGQYVEKGEFIGRVGSTGYSTGPHLHFEVRENGKQINPMKMF